MLTLRDLLERYPAHGSEADLTSAKRAIKGMVKYTRSREAARIESYLTHTCSAASRPVAKFG